MPKESDTCSMKEATEDACLCPLEGLVEIIAKKWALQIITIIGSNRTLRFNEIMERLGRISPKALTDRLKEMEAAGLVKRKAFAEIPPRVEYSLTPDGLELRRLIIPIMKWVAQGKTQKNNLNKP